MLNPLHAYSPTKTTMKTAAPTPTVRAVLRNFKLRIHNPATTITAIITPTITDVNAYMVNAAKVIPSIAPAHHSPVRDPRSSSHTHVAASGTAGTLKSARV